MCTYILKRQMFVFVFCLPGCADASREGRTAALDAAVRALVLGGER